MKTLAILPLALLALVAGPGRPTRAPHELSAEDRARVASEVAEFLSIYGEAIEGDDPEAIRSLYVTDERFAWFSDGEKLYTSAEQVLASLAAMEGMTFSTDTSEVEVVPLTPELAHASTAFHSRISREGAIVYEFDGVITWLIEGGHDGGWRVLRGHTSTPKEP